MKISEAARLSGLTVKTIRYYESIGLFNSTRSSNGYRSYTASDIGQMQFLQRSRRLGFSLDECRDLLALYQNPGRANKSVKSVASHRLAFIDDQIEHLVQMKKTLTHLIEQCPGNDDHDCVILDALSVNDTTANIKG